MLKITGAVMILAAGTGLGMSYSMDLKRHLQELRQLKQLLYMLRGEIKYTRTPLPEAFCHISERTAAPFSGFLIAVAEKIEATDGKPFSKIWKEEAQKVLRKTHLKREEREQLEALGEVLGYLDQEMQLASLELYAEQLEAGILDAKENIRAKQRVYQSLGIAGGVFLVILLL